MSLDKAIQHKKEHRKMYTGGKAVDRTCRNHGSCDFCRGNRLYASLVSEERTKAKLKEYQED